MRNRRLSLKIASLLLAASFPAVAETDYVFAANFDIRLIAGDQSSQANNRTMTRSGSTFPVAFQYHRIDMTITDIGEKKYRIDMDVYERTDETAFATADSTFSSISSDDIVFEGTYNEPVEHRWASADISINMAIAVSVIQRPSN